MPFISFISSATNPVDLVSSFIICSFSSLNTEQVINELTKSTGLVAEEMKLINGIPHRADSMFVTVLKNKA